MTGLRALFAACLALALAPACEDGSDFTAGRDAVVCSDSIPASCGTMARCVLDSDHYIEGTFPGAQKFVVRTKGAQALQFYVLLENRLSPGTSLRIEVSEPTCTGKSIYDSKGADIFQIASPDGTLGIPLTVNNPGDHLVVVSSDAYCSYKLRYE